MRTSCRSRAGAITSLVATLVVAASVAGCSTSEPEGLVVYQWGAPCADVAPTERGLCLVRPDGKDARAILSDVPGRVIDPDWSRDGTKLAFTVVGEDGVGHLWTAAADGSKAEEAVDTSTRCPAEARFPAWSPDGKQLAFGCFGRDAVPIRILVAELATGKVATAWTAAPHEQGWSPRWSPDGRSLAFELEHLSSDGERTTGTGIAVVRAEGGAARPITPVSMFGSYPDWSPDGDRIVFSSYGIDSFETGGPGATNLYPVAPDGSGLRQLTRYEAGGDRAGHPTWAPDGTRIVFTHVAGDGNNGYGTRRVAFIDPDGTNLEIVEGLSATHPRQQP